MSIQQLTTRPTNRPTNDEMTFRLPTNTFELMEWLDEQPNFISVSGTSMVKTKENGPFGGSERESMTILDNEEYAAHDRIIDVRQRVNRVTITRRVSEQMFLHPRYEVDTRACHQSQADVCEAWMEGKYPAHKTDDAQGLDGAHLYTWSNEYVGRGRMGGFFRGGYDPDDYERVINYEAIQHPDGHGVINHYQTIAAIRTKNGLVINNEQDGASGWARVTQPDDAHHTLPLSGIEDILDREAPGMTLYDIESVMQNAVDIRYKTTRDFIGDHKIVTGVQPVRNNRDFDIRSVELNNGGAVILLWDSTANNPDERVCGFYAPPEEYRHVDTVDQAFDLLEPEEVQYARLDMVPADEFSGDDATFSNEELCGDVIVRQGEWYLLPMPEGFTPENPIHKAMWNPNRQSDWVFPNSVDEYLEVDELLSEMPAECPSCGSQAFDVQSTHPTLDCKECESAFAYGSVNADDYITDDLREYYQDSLDILGNHQPRDLAVGDDGDLYVRGTFRHTSNEHAMINLQERWHLAVENTEDMTVFDLRPDYGTRGAGRRGRIE